MSTSGASCRHEYGLRDPNGDIWPVPAWIAERGVHPLTWANRVALAEGQTVVVRTVTVTDWSPPAQKSDVVSQS